MVTVGIARVDSGHGRLISRTSVRWRARLEETDLSDFPSSPSFASLYSSNMGPLLLWNAPCN